MAKLDLSMAESMFEEANNRKPYQMEREILEQVMVSTAFMVGPEEFAIAWDHFYNPPVPESDVDWAAMATDMSKWGMI